MKMDDEQRSLISYLVSCGVPRETVEELVPHVPKRMHDLPADDFCDASRITDSNQWFYWPNQTRFVLVGQCPNGDGVAIDTEENVGSIFYICHELIHTEKSIDEVVVQVADSPNDYVRKRGEPDFPWDFWEAREKGF
jgi:hypothetical protein